MPGYSEESTSQLEECCPRPIPSTKSRTIKNTKERIRSPRMRVPCKPALLHSSCCDRALLRSVSSIRKFGYKIHGQHLQYKSREHQGGRYEFDSDGISLAKWYELTHPSPTRGYRDIKRHAGRLRRRPGRSRARITPAVSTMRGLASGD